MWNYMYTCTLKTNGILGVKNTLVQSVHCVIENYVYSFADCWTWWAVKGYVCGCCIVRCGLGKVPYCRRKTGTLHVIGVPYVSCTSAFRRDTGLIFVFLGLCLRLEVITGDAALHMIGLYIARYHSVRAAFMHLHYVQLAVGFTTG
jgi:hypothetical protein